jgi:tetratricopeptide (TPR) repeat protein
LSAGSVPSGAVLPGALTALLGELARAPAASGWSVPAQPGERIGRFEIVRELGRGGFGVVYEARDVELGRSVAFKAIRTGASDAAREERALAEAEAAARLAHPNIVHLYDLGRCERGAYLILELLRGESLEDRLARGPFRLRDAVHVATEIARGLAHAHAQNVVHRDLKPGNVFLCDDGQVKVLDFGLAHVFGRGGLEGGTPSYMAPEQARGEPADARADVYALGVIVHELVTGRRPFEDGVRGLADGARPPPLPGAPAALAKLASRMLARDPGLRPADAGEAHAALGAIRKSLEPRRLLWAAWLVAAGALVAAGILALRSRPPPPGRLLVAIADAANATGEPDLDETGSLLGTALEQSRRVSIVARSRLVGLVRRSGGGAPARLDERAARDLARRVDAQALIVPAVRRAGDAYEVEIRGIDLARDEALFTVRERAAAKRGVPEALDRASERIRRELREDPKDAPGRPVLVARTVSSSPEAMRAYWEGRRLLDDGRDREAVAAFERAVAADPEFPLAHAALAIRAAFFDQAAQERHFAAALAAADRLPPKDRLLLEARRAKLRGRLDEALALWDRAIAEWPQDPTAYVQAGSTLWLFYSDAQAARPYQEKALALAELGRGERVGVLVALGRLDEALQEARRWAADEPRPHAYAILSMVLRRRGEHAAALEAARRVVSFGFLPGASEGGQRRSEQAFWSFVEAGAIEEIEALYAEKGLRSWEVLVLQGRLRAAIAALDDDARRGVVAGVPIAKAPPDLRAVYHAVRGALLWGTAHPERMWPEIEEMLRLGAAAASCAAPLLAAAGERERAERLTSLWAALEDPRTYCPRLYRHVRQWKVGDLESAARGLATMSGPEPAYHLGVVLGELGRDREAVEAFRRFRRDPAYNMEGTNVVAYPRSLYLEAAALDRLGQRQEAASTVARLIDLWRRAEPDTPYLREARALARRLGAVPAAR